MPEKKKSTIGRVIALLSARDRRNLAIVFVVSLAAAAVDVMGVGSLGPFLAVASNPAIIHSNVWLRGVYNGLGFTSDQWFLVALGLCVIGFVVTTNVFKALTRYTVVRFTSISRHKLSHRMMEGYLRQEYPFFLSRNSHEFVKNITGEIQQVVQGTLMTFVDMTGAALQLALFITFLLVVNPLVTIIIASSVGVVYGLIYGGLRSTVKKLGQRRFDLNRDRSRVASETFWGIKDTKLLGVEKAFLDQYDEPSLKLAKNESNSEVAGDIPKFALEALAFSMILGFVLWVVVQTGSFKEAAVTVSLFAFASYRMIPAMQNLFKAVTKMRYGAPSAHRVADEFALLKNKKDDIRTTPTRMVFSHNLTLDGVSFVYPNTDRKVLDQLSFVIPRNTTVGFAGPTGSGKTTLIDLVLGLLVPTEGRLLVDGTPVDAKNRRSWQSLIGYVPQSIYLSNTSVARNIAFGVPPQDIDMVRVEKAARLAQIHDFIVSEMKNGYETPVGERGIRLSGGQRQRLGIARALYREPEILVFDEATSALDNHTEAVLMEAVNSLSGKLTVLMIAHRLTTLKECNTIYVLGAGRIMDQGTYSDLVSRDKNFRESK